MEVDQTTVTRIMLSSMMDNNGLPEHLRREARDAGLTHAQAVAMCERFVRGVVSASLDGSMMPDFAQDILDHALSTLVDWRFLGERLLTDPESN